MKKVKIKYIYIHSRRCNYFKYFMIYLLKLKLSLDEFFIFDIECSGFTFYI